jgi:hypothetical protein
MVLFALTVVAAPSMYRSKTALCGGLSIVSYCNASSRCSSHRLSHSIKQFPGQKEFLLRAHFGLPSIGASDSGPPVNAMKKPITVKFEIPYFTVSGVQVRYLKIMEKSGYQALPWVRYITQNGDYHIRTS